MMVISLLILIVLKHVQPHLVDCDVCKKSNLVLDVVNISNIYQKLRLTCPVCSINNSATYNSMNYLTEIIPETHYADRAKKKRQLANTTTA